MAKKSLDQIRDDLQAAFDKAIEYGTRYVTNEIGPEHLKAAAQLAQAIVVVESKIDDRNADKNTIKLPAKPAMGEH